MKSKTILGRGNKRKKSSIKANVCISVYTSQILYCFPTETLPGVLLDGNGRQLLCTVGPDPGSDRGPGGTAAPGQDGDRGPETGV